MLKTSQQLQVPRPMLATHQHHLDCMFQSVGHLMTAYRISTQQINLITYTVNVNYKKINTNLLCQKTLTLTLPLPLPLTLPNHTVESELAAASKPEKVITNFKAVHFEA